ncbi:MAG: MATE family efflux transporter [Gammaproteobacteria bacterium]|nr:MATE family efflux transporter [Gammaproteobacteria bacterium]
MDDGSKPANATFTEGDLSRHLMRLSGYMILGFVAMTLASFVEIFYLGRVGTEAIAAVTFAFPVLMVIGAATRGIGVGIGAVLARAIGAGDRERAAFLTTHGLLLVLMFNIACSVLLIVFARPLFHLLGARDAVLDLVVAYIRISAIGYPLFGLSMVGTGLMRAIGDPVYPGIVITAGSVLQVLIGPFLIFGWLGLPALGVEGAAWSFVVARSASFLIGVYWFCFRERMIRTSLVRFGTSAREILHVGLPAMTSNVIEPLAAAVVTRLLAPMGAAVVAGFGVGSRIESIVFMVVIGIATNAAPLVGQNWGARRFDRVNEALRLCYRYCLLWGVIAAVIMWAGGEFFVTLIRDDAEVVATATSYLYIIPITIGFAGMFNTANGAFNALSKPLPPLVLSLLRLLVFYIPLALVARHWFGYVGIFAAAAFTNVVLGVWGREWNRRTVIRQRRRLVGAVG